MTADTLKDYVSKGRTALAITEMRTLVIANPGLTSQVVMLESRYNELASQKRVNMISYEQYSIESSKINVSVLDMIDLIFKALPNSTTVHHSTQPADMTITINFGAKLTQLEQVKKTYVQLNERLENDELTPAEIYDFCDALFDATQEDDFIAIKRAMEDAVRTRIVTKISDGMKTAVEALNNYQAPVITFFKTKNAEAKTAKTVYQCLADFSNAPSEGTWEQFAASARDTFKSEAFYTDDIRTRLESLLNDVPAMEGFGWKAKVGTYVERCQTWLNTNFKS